MTTIIGLQWQWGCEIAADGRTTSDGRPFTGASMVKVVARGEYILAAAGSGGACDWVTHAWKPPVFKGPSVYEFLVGSFSPHLQKSLNANGFQPSKDDDGVSLLVAVAGEVFQIEGDGTVMQDVRGLYGIGTGSAYALGAIEAGADIDEAFEIAARFDIYTSPPITVVKQVFP